MKRLVLILSLVVSFVFSQNVANSQCAMCKLNAENASKENVNFAKGLNNGIVYLMGIPYGLLLLGGLVFYKSLSKREAEIRADKIS